MLIFEKALYASSYVEKELDYPRKGLGRMMLCEEGELAHKEKEMRERCAKFVVLRCKNTTVAINSAIILRSYGYVITDGTGYVGHCNCLIAYVKK